MRRDVQAVLLVLVGGAILRLSLSGAYTNYVKQSMGLWLTIAGCVLVALGAWGAVVAFRAHGLAAEAAPGLDATPGEIDDGHGHGSSRAAWLLLLPVVAIFVVAPPALGAYSANRTPVVVPQPPAEDLPPLVGDPVQIGVVDYAMRAVWDDGRSLAGREVQMVGFVTHGADGASSALYLTKLQISCCAADAQPYKVKVLGDFGPYADNQWVTVRGHWVPGGGTQRDDAIPWVQARTVTPVKQPADPYE